MSLPEQITAYLCSPFAVIDAPLAVALAEAGQQRLTRASGVAVGQYSVANCLYPAAAGVQGLALGTSLPRLELPELARMGSFYEEYGLEPLRSDELAATEAGEKLRLGWVLLEKVPAVGASLHALVKTIQVLRSPDPEIDVSYSHPAIPFSVFVSVGEDYSLVSSLRVAESLLHEAMHLQHTLLEQEAAMVQPDSQALYYSPWRDEDRPIRGVLHGLFVFAAVREFYSVLMRSVTLGREATGFVEDRLTTIIDEFETIGLFPTAPGLTVDGSRLATNLLAHCAVANKQ